MLIGEATHFHFCFRFPLGSNDRGFRNIQNFFNLIACA